MLKISLEYILLIDRIKCRLNIPLQVLSVAPLLHSLVIRERNDVAEIVQFLDHNYINLKKLILGKCLLGEDGPGLFANIVKLCPHLEVLSLKECHPTISTGYCLIPCLKKLSELNLSHCQVDYVCVMLETHMCMRVACGRTPLEIRFSIWAGR